MLTSSYRQLWPWVLSLGLLLTAYTLWQQQQQLAAQLQASQYETDEIKQLSQAYLDIVSTKTPNLHTFSQISPARSWLLANSKQQGLKVRSKTSSGSQTEVTVALQNAHFNRLLQWLQSVETTTNLVVINSQLAAQDKPGVVSGSVTFEVN